jgi:glycosyltransferase involved in cell wall biosynthesis
MNKVLVSFSTRPGRGGEGGVGWGFLRAAAEYSLRNNVVTHVVVDARDVADIAGAVSSVPGASQLRISPVSLPVWALQRYGDARTRASYLAWLPAARRAVRDLVGGGAVDLVHQVTFATATMPSVLPRSNRVKRVWGPVAMPFEPMGARGAAQAWWRERLFKLARRAAIQNSRRADFLIATNELTAGEFRRAGRRTEVEPNIAVDLHAMPKVEQDPLLVSIAGLLIDRKRPWVAIEALATQELAAYRLQVIGDGPLRTALEELAVRLGVKDRVEFLGRLAHRDALAAIGRSRLLLHPAAREGAAWVIGEAAALGVPTVAFADVGSASTVLLSSNGGEVVEAGKWPGRSLAEGAARALARPAPEPVSRWHSDRFVDLLERWWSHD